jgi:hypothetical protein
MSRNWLNVLLTCSHGSTAVINQRQSLIEGVVKLMYRIFSKRRKIYSQIETRPTTLKRVLKVDKPFQLYSIFNCGWFGGISFTLHSVAGPIQSSPPQRATEVLESLSPMPVSAASGPSQVHPKTDYPALAEEGDSHILQVGRP